MDKIIANKEESIRVKEKEIEVMKENYETVMRLNKQSTDCVKNLEDALGKVNYVITCFMVDRGNLVLRHSVLRFLLNSRGIPC